MAGQIQKKEESYVNELKKIEEDLKKTINYGNLSIPQQAAFDHLLINIEQIMIQADNQKENEYLRAKAKEILEGLNGIVSGKGGSISFIGIFSMAEINELNNVFNKMGYEVRGSILQDNPNERDATDVWREIQDKNPHGNIVEQIKKFFEEYFKQTPTQSSLSIGQVNANQNTSIDENKKIEKEKEKENSDISKKENQKQSNDSSKSFKPQVTVVTVAAASKSIDSNLLDLFNTDIGVSIPIKNGDYRFNPNNESDKFIISSIITTVESYLKDSGYTINKEKDQFEIRKDPNVPSVSHDYLSFNVNSGNKSFSEALKLIIDKMNHMKFKDPNYPIIFSFSLETEKVKDQDISVLNSVITSLKKQEYDVKDSSIMPDNNKLKFELKFTKTTESKEEHKQNAILTENTAAGGQEESNFEKAINDLKSIKIQITENGQKTSKMLGNVNKAIPKIKRFEKGTFNEGDSVSFNMDPNPKMMNTLKEIAKHWTGADVEEKRVSDNDFLYFGKSSDGKPIGYGVKYEKGSYAFRRFKQDEISQYLTSKTVTQQKETKQIGPISFTDTPITREGKTITFRAKTLDRAYKGENFVINPDALQFDKNVSIQAKQNSADKFAEELSNKIASMGLKASIKYVKRTEQGDTWKLIIEKTQ